MPEMNGVQLSKTVHATFPDVSTILVTGFGNGEVLKDLGGGRTLEKPYTEGELVERIQTALKH
jgi:FixJ family two-component response regulator